ncbi:hypothetical protein PYCCODRAFT_1357124 [Trametes coccinea BRFM310]|uniref:Uncharacterized protein n=1 Tax=Trametes coccinea (strain BRFM310) TaxID=1353009 RepID=A0A1Y2J502_TRAC3|nr:hypothetical protein PYCCODRAFT_1357124 [Trametes coccinea BRFM310]
MKSELAPLYLRLPGAYRGYLLAALLSTIALGLLYLKYALRSKDAVLPETRAALTSMYAVITPTQSLWPQHYLSLARSAAVSNRKCIHLSLGTLYRDLLNDVVELRNPRDHLPVLLSGHLSGHMRIRLNVELSWWFRLFWWTFCCNLRSGNPVLIVRYANTSATDNSRLVSTPPPPYPTLSEDPADASSAPPSTLFHSMLYENARSVSLDCVPFHALESSVRELQKSLASGTRLIVGFTARARNNACSRKDPSLILSALPFFPRAYLKARKHSPNFTAGNTERERTTTPLYVTLPLVLKLLTSGPAPLTVELVRNVSEEYAAFLRRSVQDLEEDREIRDAFAREWGVAGWREERVCTAWEAALVDAGLLAGWAVVVRK